MLTVCCADVAAVVLMLQAVASRVDCVRKDSELAELRIAADEAIQLAETADSERKKIRTCFNQSIHDMTKSYEHKVSLEGLRERTEYIDIFLLYAHHSVVFCFRCSVYWWKGNVRF